MSGNVTIRDRFGLAIALLLNLALSPVVAAGPLNPSNVATLPVFVMASPGAAPFLG